MALNSINTNIGAQVALESLQSTQSQLASTQKQISTGYRVADSTDDGAAYAIAQSVRSDVSALGAANQQLGSVQGLLSTTQTGLNSASKTLNSMRDVLTNLTNSGLNSGDQSNYISQYKSLLSQLNSDFTNATYHGKTLIGAATNVAVTVTTNESGSTFGIATFGGVGVGASLVFTTAQLSNATSVGGIISGVLATKQSAVGAALNTVGGEINYVNNQVTYNNNKIDALNTGLGALVDADLAKESASLTALQIRQQLGTQALSLANQAPQSILSLFR